MNAYKVTGKPRTVGAIGIFEPFEEYVTANNQEEAREYARQEQYAKSREHVTTEKVKKIRLWVNEYVIQEYTGALYGWEDSTSEDNRKDALKQLRLYRENAGVPVRMVTRKMMNPLLTKD